MSFSLDQDNMQLQAHNYALGACQYLFHNDVRGALRQVFSEEDTQILLSQSAGLVFEWQKYRAAGLYGLRHLSTHKELTEWLATWSEDQIAPITVFTFAYIYAGALYSFAEASQFPEGTEIQAITHGQLDKAKVICEYFMHSSQTNALREGK